MVSVCARSWFAGTVLSVFVLASCVVSADGPREVVGELRMPAQWRVFGPVKQSDPVLSRDVLRTFPDVLHVGDRELQAKEIQVPDGRLDLAPVLGGTKAGRTAYVFVVLDAPRDGVVTLGMGADWWMQVWVDGRRICDTTGNGNELWPPSITNFTRNVTLTKGQHVLAVRFISGSGSSVLVLGGPTELRAVPAPAWASVKPKPSVVLGAETVANGGFEEGQGDPWCPDGWTHSDGDSGFAPGELRATDEKPLAGSSSLEINTLGGATRRRKLFTRLSLTPGQLYRIAYRARHIDGSCVSISLRETPQGSGVLYFLDGGRIGKGHKGEYEGFYFVENPRPYLVIEAREPARVLLDAVSIRLCPDRSRMWGSWQEQRIPWEADWDRITSDMVTPHTPVAKPHAQGTVRVLSVRPRWEQRWAAELTQRFDVACAPLMFRDPNFLGGDYWVVGADGEPVVRDVLDASLAQVALPTDCIVVSGLSASAIPAALVEAICARVREGTGLVITGFRQPFYPYPDGRGAEAVDKYKVGPWSRALSADHIIGADTEYVQLGPIESADAEFYGYGQGRIAFLRHAEVDGVSLRSTDPDNPRDRFEYEMAYVMKAVLWATRRVPSCRISIVEIPGGDSDTGAFRVGRDSLPMEVPIGLSNDLDSTSTIACRILDWYGNEESADEVPVPKGAQEALLQIPVLPGGRHIIHLQLRSRDGVVDWTSIVLDVTQEPDIREIRFPPDAPPYYRIGERIRGTAVLSAVPAGSDCEVRLSLVDGQGGLWHSERRRVRGEEIPFDVPTDDLVHLTHRLRVALLQGDSVLGQAVHELVVVPRNDVLRTHLDAQIWQLPAAGHLGALLAEIAHGQLHLTNSLAPGHGPSRGQGRGLARADMRPVGGIAYYPGRRNKLATDDAYAPEREPCLSSPSLRASLASVGRKWSLRALPYGMLAYATDHEQNLLGCTSCLKNDADICFSASCLASLRRFLQGEYDDVSALNASWGTAFADWADVRPAVLSQALSDGQIPRWVDHRRHMDRVWADFTRYKLEFLRKHDPHAQGVVDNLRSGETTLNSYNGIDYWMLLSESVAGAASPMSYLLSFVPQERQHLVWLRDAAWHPDKWSGHRDLFQVRFATLPWKALLEGANGYSYWAWAGQNQPESNVMCPVWPDFRPTYLGRAVAETGARIQSGLDRFVLESQRHDSHIGLYYSRASEHVCTAWHALVDDPAADALDPRSSQFSFFAPGIRTAGREFASIAYGQVARGDLGTGRFRLLILPFAQAIAPAECREIRDFVRDGGTVLADVRPAICDEHGRPGDSGGLLDDVFGIRQQPALSSYVPSRGDVHLDGTLGGRALQATLPDMVLGPNLDLTTAEALGASDAGPALTINRFGKGRAILLNFSSPGGTDDVSAMDDLWDGLFAACGIDRVFAIAIQDEWWLTEGGEKVRLADVTGERGSGAAGLASPEDAGEVEGIAAASSTRAVPRLARFTNGGIRCFGVWFPQRRGRGYQRLTVDLPADGHVYDLLTGEYRGTRTEFEVTIPLEGLAAWSVVPFKIRKPNLKARVTEGELTGLVGISCAVEVRPSSARSEALVVQLRLFAPDGSEWTGFATSVTASGGVARHVFRLPRNAPRGRWTIRAREAITGLEDHDRVRL